ncbi:hypothetical protein [Streptomyces violaceusniger]|uniref:hypothetical protein n=1 Tax=Streptomyces violaceusniger TaxID=68280 RepID=UPI0031E2A61A
MAAVAADLGPHQHSYPRAVGEAGVGQFDQFGPLGLGQHGTAMPPAHDVCHHFSWFIAV